MSFKKPLFKSMMCWSVVSTLNCAIGTIANAQSVPNVQQGAPGELLFYVKNSSEHQAQSRIRVAVIDYLGGYVITTPEGPGSNAQTALDRRILAWDVSDPQNPEIKYSFSFSNDQFFTQSGFRAHGSMLRGNQLNVGNDSNAITLMPDGSLALQPWEGARRPSEITGVDGQIYTTNQNRDNPFAANTASMNRPWNFVESWNYSSQAADADGDKVADSSGAIILRDQQLTKWDITGGDRIRGFGTFMGNLFLHSSDQRNNGMAVYDMADIRSQNGETKPRLLDTINTPGSATNGAGIGGYWSEAVSHYMVFASRDDNNSGRRGVQAVDFSDPQNLKLACQFDAGTHNDWRLRPQTMYLGFKDEYVYSDNYKLNLETCDATNQWQPELTLDVAQGQSTKVVDTTQYSRVIGNLWFTGGHPQGSSNSLGGMAIWVDQSAPDSRAPAVAYHIPQANQTNYPVNLPLSFSIPETLDSTTLITTETAAPGQTETLTLTEVGGDKVRVDYVLAHSGMLTLDPVNGLKANTTYEVSFTDGIQEATGNRMQPYSFRFSTGDSVTQPSVEPVLVDVTISPNQVVKIGDAVTISLTVTNADEYEIRLEGENNVWSNSPTRTFSFDQIGQYNVQVRARNNVGVSDLRLITINVEANQIAAIGTNSSHLYCDVNTNQVWTVNPDNDSFSLLNADTNTLVTEISGPKDPQGIAVASNGDVWVSAKSEDKIYVYDTVGDVKTTIELDYGAAPSHILPSQDGQSMYVSLYGSGHLAIINQTNTNTVQTIALSPTVKAMSLSPDGKTLLVAKFISTQQWAEVYEIDIDNNALRKTIKLDKSLTDDQPTDGRGLFNYLASILIGPDGKKAYVVAKKDNIDKGVVNASSADLSNENTVRTILAVIDLQQGVELVGLRKDFDNFDSASALALNPNSQDLYVTLQGLGRVLSFQLDQNGDFVGGSQGNATPLAPQAACYMASNRKLFTKGFTSREIGVLDTINGLNSTSLQTVGVVNNEVLSSQELSGLQIFYNASNGIGEDGNITGKMSQEGYISCATCHADGADDGQVWDFSGRGEGLRNTISLKGRKGTRFGDLHWSANFDEVHDFENDIRTFFGGRGFMDDADLSDPLGSPKAGKSDELDALAAYVSSLGKESLSRSPYRQDNGSLTAAAQVGEQVFTQQGCASCHSGKAFTDGETHDVGTTRDYSGTTLTAIKTPSLLSVFETPPYLHDGSAKTIADIFTTVGGTVVQAESAVTSVGNLIEHADYSYLRAGKAVQLNANNASLTFADIDGGAGGAAKLRVRYGSSIGQNTLQVSVNGVVQATGFDLETLPLVAGENVNFAETSSIDISLQNGNNTIELTLNGNSVIIDDMTVSNIDNIASADAHTKVAQLAAVDQSNLIDYVLQIDRSSAPEDDDASPMENNVDRDGDGIKDDVDNCPAIANADQADVDNNGIGDACESTLGGTQFYRGVNINGAAATLGGQALEADQGAANFVATGAQHVSSTAPEPSRSGNENAVLQSFKYSNSEAAFSSVSNGDYEVYVWVFEDNWNVTFDVAVNGQVADSALSSGTGGSYKRHGPYPVSVTNGEIKTSLSGDANFAAIEVWKKVSLKKPEPRIVETINGLSIAVDASSSTDEDGTIIAYRWGMGDGTRLDGSVVQHEYANAGRYPVTLAVEDNDGQIVSTSKTVTIIKPNVLPVADFVIANNGLKVTVDANASSDSDGSINRYEWTFRDASGTELASASGAIAEYSFANAGTYQVVLVVTDNEGAQSIATNQSVTVVAPTVNLAPTAQFTATANGLSVSVDASSSSDPEGGALSYAWHFGEVLAGVEQQGSGVTANHGYQAADSYVVTLTVSDDQDLTDSITQTVTVTDVVDPNPAIQVLVPTDDKAKPNSANGVEPQLAFSFWNHAFMRFDLADIQSPVTRATLRLHYSGNVAVTARLLGVINDSWNEENGELPDLTGYPWTAAVNNELSQVSLSTPGYVEIDVTDYILAEMTGNNIASFELMHDLGGFQRVSSKEGNNSPELLIETEQSNLITVTVDNTDTATSQVGNWSASGGADPYAGGSVFSTGSASTFTWNADLAAAGNYDVQVYWTHFGNRTTQAVYSVQHRDGVANVDKNQRNENESGRWVSIGQYAFAAGDVTVVLSNAGQGTLSADAVRFVPNNIPTPVNQAPTADFTVLTNSLSVTVNASGSSDPEGGALSYSWNFGHQSASAVDVSASYAYPAASTYTVTLTVTDPQGETDSKAIDIVVTEPVVATAKPRVIIQTDGEEDDRNSLIRAMYYANEVDIEAIISSDHPQRPNESKTLWAHETVDAYGLVRDNLSQHADGFPTAVQLKSRIYEDETLQATNVVLAALLDNDPRDVWYLVWGPFGGSSLRDAMQELQTRSIDEQNRALAKLRVYSIYGQSLPDGGAFPNRFSDWFPGKLKTIVNTKHFGAMAYNGRTLGYAGGFNDIPIDPADVEWRLPVWQANYEGNGALSDLYIGPDDGKPWVHEGDTPSFLHILPFGLRSTEDPTYGGWGGRFNSPSHDGAHWIDSSVAEGGFDTKSVSRWWAGSENDYAARNDWANTSSYAAANHAPVAVLNHERDLTAAAGSTVSLSAVGSSDPDGDALTYKWYQYAEADTYSGQINVNNADQSQASFVLPLNAAGENIHIILEVTDNGSPQLTRYQRVIVAAQ